MGGVDLLRQRAAAARACARAAGDVVGDRRQVGGLPQAGDDLLPDRLVAGIDVMQVHGGGVRRPLAPQVSDGARQQPQHAAHALEVAQRGGLAGERGQHLGMERVAGAELLRGLRAGGVRGERAPHERPLVAVGVDRGLRLRFVDLFEQAPPEHLHGFIFGGGVEQRGLARGDALRLRHAVADKAVLLAVGVGRAAVLADRQGVDQRRARRSLHRLEQRGEKGGQLVAGAGQALHLAQVDRQLVEQDQGRRAAEQFAQGLGAGGGPLPVAAAHPFVALPAGQGVGDLAPRRVRQHPAAHRAAIGGVGVLAVERRHAHRFRRQQRRIDKLADARNRLLRPRAHRVHQGDQRVRLAAAVGGVEAEDRRRLAAGPAQPPADVGQQIFESARRVGVGEEPGRIAVLGAAPAADHGGQVGGEVGFGHAAGEHVGARPAGVEDRRRGHDYASRLRSDGSSMTSANTHGAIGDPR